MTIDINCDMGESFGNFQIGNDALLLPLVTSANIACGFHGGDPYHIEKTIDLALENGVAIGAHPSYPDLQGFGRRKMYLKKEELQSIIKYQVAALKSLVESKGGKLQHVKPHGALYNSISNDKEEATHVVEAVKSIAPNVFLMGLAGSHVAAVCEMHSMSFIAEAFIDRRYDAHGKLVSRNIEGSKIETPEATTKQVIDMVLKNETETIDGKRIPIKAQSFCIHGDNPKAFEILKHLNEALEKEGIQKKAFGWK